ncbi:MAG: type II toxin-antitoxin system VapC family toxin [Thermoanaerobaculia bacterium]
MIVLDTHAWVQLGLDPERLSRRAHSAIRRQRHGVEISAFTLWETAWHVRRGHIQPKKPLDEWLPEFAAALQSRVHALSTEIVVQAAMLAETFPSDPGDRLITATAIVLGCPLVTADEKIRAAKVVETIW